MEEVTPVVNYLSQKQSLKYKIQEHMGSYEVKLGSIECRGYLQQRAKAGLTLALLVCWFCLVYQLLAVRAGKQI
jgi:hypothetical protein